MTTRIDRIAATLRAVADRTDPASIFGADKHRFRLGPPLPEAEVAAVENAHRVRLPEGYRRFVVELGDGGAGPSYGLHTLAEAFDLAEGTVTAPARVTPRRRSAADPDETSPHDGTIPIAHHGCGDYSVLVITGAHRGRIVDIAEVDDIPQLAADADFLDWYERWLDELAAGYEVSRFSRRLPGDQTTLLRHVEAETDPDRRRRAVSSLLKLPRLTDDAVPVLAEAATAADPALRSAVMAVIGGADCAALLPVAVRGLADPRPKVRAAALDALRFALPPDLADHARGLLGDADATVVWAAMMALAASGELTAADLTPLSNDPRARVRRDARYFLTKL